MSDYQRRWQLAMALKRRPPSAYDVGDVMPVEPAPSGQASITTTTGTWRDNLQAFADTVRAARTIVIGTGVLGLLVGGIIGFEIGKKR